MEGENSSFPISTQSTIDQLAQVLLPSTMESLLSQLSSPSSSLLPLTFLPPLSSSSSSYHSSDPSDDLLRALDSLPSSVSSAHSLLSPPIHAPTPIRPTPFLSPHSYSSSLGSCGSLPLSSLSSSPSALSPLPTSLSSGSSAFSLLQLPILSDPFSPLGRRCSAPEGPPRPELRLNMEKRRFSDFSSDLHESSSSSELRRRHSMLPSSITIPERKSSNPRKQRTIYAGGQTKVLEEAFLSQRYMVGTEREALASKLGLSEAQVRVWFQNRRSKHRKQRRTLSGSFDIPPSSTVLSPTIITTVSSTVPQFNLPSTGPLSPTQLSALGPLFSSTLPSFEALSSLSTIRNLEMRDN
ncbi:ceh-23 [Pristionchus pacificus]|uniref:Ceh-23 n=1 Tax=Pristionchus pacificus TaxID=54126 RepID=A0A2A6BJ91_PRIPA|nr:ceh-23 [Pristionchus pacificus]|eukprot:PDM65985.1 ceh-23 [Pristionchus pacificus]